MSDLIDRQAAIDALRNYLVGKNVPCDGTLTARLIENEVINKLPSAQPTFDARDTQYNLPIGTDMIDRQKAIDALRKKQDNGKGDISRFYNTIIQHDIEAIMALPSAQPEPLKIDLSGYSEEDWERLKKEWGNTPITVLSAQPKRGKWIEYEQEFMLKEPLKTVQKTVKECSVCTAKIAGMVGIMNFCPNCGAKMEVTT